MNACRDKAGTYTGARRHQRADQKLCEPCRLARNTYRNRRYAMNPPSRNAKARRAQAYVRATSDLRDRHPQEFQALYRQRLSEAWEHATHQAAAVVAYATGVGL